MAAPNPPSSRGPRPTRPQPAPPKGRPWSQRIVLFGSVSLSAIALIAALAIVTVQHNLEQIKRVDIESAPIGETKSVTKLTVESLVAGLVKSTVVDNEPDNTLAPLVTAPKGSIKSVNFLMTGSDNRSCIDRNSRFASTFLAGSAAGNRPDTIMLLHVETDSGTVSMLSFPRDLWVPVAGTNRMAKINSTFSKNDPQRLINTIESFFKIKVDHYVSIDFCVFKDLVNAVGGITIPFATALRDRNTRLDVPEPGCFTFDGDHALAYVRSRHMQYRNAAGVWKSEGTADIGRIKRQQDFIRRVMNAVRSKGSLNIGLVTKLVKAFEKRVIVDRNLTASDVLTLAGALKGFDPASTRSFIVEGVITNKAEQSVVDPRLGSARMRAILAVFQGNLRIKDAPKTSQSDVYGTKSITPDSSQTC